jgi:hypothetical protein
MLKFTDPEVESRYECLVEKDRRVEKLGVYSGLLSRINRKTAVVLVRGGSNLLKEKAATNETLEKQDAVIERINAATTVEEVEAIAGNDTRKKVVDAAAARKAQILAPQQ